MRLLITIFVISCFLACKDASVDPPKKPNNLIPQDKLAIVIEEMLLISAAKGVNKQIMETKGLQPDTYIFDKYQIDSIQFKESNIYYAYDVEGYRKMYEQIQKNLERRRAGYQRLLDEERRKRDSVIKANKTRDSLKRVKQRKKVDSLKKLGAKPSLVKKQ